MVFDIKKLLSLLLALLPFQLAFQVQPTALRAARRTLFDHGRLRPLLLAHQDGYGEDAGTSTRKSKAGRRPLRIKTKSREEAQLRREQAQERQDEAEKDPTLLSSVDFTERIDISSQSKRALVDLMGLKTMTEVQAQTYTHALDGSNILARSRTGTGKTIAFLLPAIERLVEAPIDHYQPRRSIGILVIAPTRELAIQIADQAGMLLTYHQNLSVGCIYGGTKMQRDLRILRSTKGLPSILVATPGRFIDHLKETRVLGRTFGDIIGQTKIVVFDETDHLFGEFSREMKQIQSYLIRPEKRQTLLFSATVPRSLQRVLKDDLKMDYIEVNCVKESDSDTNLRVEQSFVQLSSMNDYIWMLLAIIMNWKDTTESSKQKAMIFLPTVKLVRLAYTILELCEDFPVFELHSRLSQGTRKRVSDRFRDLKRCILLTSDVSARGVDYPGVSLVVQYGYASSRDKYIHRLGRTGRAGAQGNGITVLLPWEREKANVLESDGACYSTDLVKSIIEYRTPAHAILAPFFALVDEQHEPHHSICDSACLSFLAHYIGSGCKPAEMYDAASSIARALNLKRMPEFEASLAEKLGLSSVVADNN